MARKVISPFDDPFDSTISSPTTLPESALLNTVPGSALAERIFNDPNAWVVLSKNDSDRPKHAMPLDEMVVVEEKFAWLENEIKQFSMPSTPILLNGNGSPLPNEDATIPQSPTHSNIVKETLSRYQDLLVPRSVQQDRRRRSVKPGPVAVFPAYVHDPPGGPDSPRQNLTSSLPGLEENDVIHFLNADLLEDNVSMELHVHFSRVMANDATTPSMEPLSAASDASSPPLLESLSSSSSSTQSGFNSSPAGNTNLHVPPASGLPAPSYALTSIISPFNIHSASATLIFLEWHGIRASSPLGSAGSPGTNTKLTPSLTSVKSHMPSLTQTVISVQPDNEPRNVPRATPQTRSQSDYLISEVVDNHLTNIANLDNGTASLSSQSSMPPCLPDNLKRHGIIYEVPKRRPGMPLIRAPPKPAPTIPLPNIPVDDGPPPVPPKDVPLPSRPDKGKSKALIRRLPMVPTKPAVPSHESEIKAEASPIIYTPPLQPPHTNIVRPARSFGSCPTIKLTVTPPRSCSRSKGSDTSLNNSLTSITRSPRCPAGPRQRGGSNNPTPCKSAGQFHANPCSDMSVMSMVNMVTSSSHPLVAVSRSVSAQKGVAYGRHVHSKSK